LAPDTTAPVGSVTVPVMPPKTVWAPDRRLKEKPVNSKRAHPVQSFASLMTASTKSVPTGALVVVFWLPYRGSSLIESV
jgi:hypothetical protein